MGMTTGSAGKKKGRKEIGVTPCPSSTEAAAVSCPSVSTQNPAAVHSEASDRAHSPCIPCEVKRERNDMKCEKMLSVAVLCT